VPVLPVVKDDSRPAPEFEVLHRQLVGTEDVYLGLSDMDPSSTRCQELTMKIKLPGVEHKQIQVDLTATSLVLQTPRHYLHHFFPYRVRDKQAKAKWVSDKNLLELFLPI
jgi:dynein assembly factor 6, axonemal